MKDPQVVSPIIERSRQAAERGDVWTPRDHARLLRHLREIDRLAQQVVEKARIAGADEAALRRIWDAS